VKVNKSNICFRCDKQYDSFTHEGTRTFVSPCGCCINGQEYMDMLQYLPCKIPHEDKIGHVWINNCVCPFVCKNCGTLSGTDESLLFCKKSEDNRFIPPSEPQDAFEEACDKLVGCVAIWTTDKHPKHGRSGGRLEFDTDRSSCRDRYHIQKYYEDNTYAGGSDSFSAEELCIRLLNQSRVIERLN